MKKIFILLSLFLFGLNSVKAEINEQNFCPVEIKTGNAFSRGISNITGANFLATKIIELAIQKEIKKSLGAKVNVEIYPYSFGDLTQGKFKKITIDAKTTNFSGVRISDFYAETMCNYMHVEQKGDDIFFKENAGLNFSFKITNDDLEVTTKAPQFLKMVNSAKISLLGQTLFRVNSVKIVIKNNKLFFLANVVSPFMWGVEPKTVVATSDIKVENGRIFYSNFQIKNLKLEKQWQTLSNLFDKINPFMFEINITKNSYGYTKIKNVIIDNNEIKVNGIIYIPKNN